jgi:hypothetical protein
MKKMYVLFVMLIALLVAAPVMATQPDPIVSSVQINVEQSNKGFSGAGGFYGPDAQAFGGQSSEANGKATVFGNGSEKLDAAVTGSTTVLSGVEKIPGVSNQAVSYGNTQNTASVNSLTTGSPALVDLDISGKGSMTTSADTGFSNNHGVGFGTANTQGSFSYSDGTKGAAVGAGSTTGQSAVIAGVASGVAGYNGGIAINGISVNSTATGSSSADIKVTGPVSH